ncbi:MAG: hypothetical protein Tsb0014_36420 [Pleurocapsa sp.]
MTSNLTTKDTSIWHDGIGEDSIFVEAKINNISINVNDNGTPNAGTILIDYDANGVG